MQKIKNRAKFSKANSYLLLAYLATRFDKPRRCCACIAGC